MGGSVLNDKHLFHSVSVLAVALSASWGQSALAQQVTGPERQPQEQALSPATTASASPTEATTGPAADQAADTGGLTDIVVTARKVAESQQRVPVAITVQTGEMLQQQNAVAVPDIARLSPGISIRSSGGTPTAIQLTIRGQNQFDVIATLDPSVGTYVDGFYWARAYGLNANLLDVQSAQVLRGPQGTLFGRNTTGGALLLQTNDPNPSEFSGLVSGTYGRFDERIGTAVLNIPIVEDKVALRGAFTINKRDGFYTNETFGSELGDRNSYSGRVKLLLKPTETLSILLSAELFRTRTIPRPYQLAYVGPVSPANIEAALEANPANAALLATPAGQGQLIGIGRGIFANYINSRLGTDRVALNEDPVAYAKTQTYTGTVTLDTYFGSLKIIGGYRKVDASSSFDLDGSPVNILRTLGAQSLDSYSGEFQINGKALDRLTFVAGAFAFHEGGTDGSTSLALNTLSQISSRGVLPQTIIDGRIDTDSIGVYAQGSLDLSEKFSLVAGLRYSIDDKGLTIRNRVENAATGARLSCSVIGSDPATCEIGRKDDYDGVSYTFGLNYQITPDVLIYAKSSKGFRSGGQNLRASGNAGAAFTPFEPEIAREQEAGLKSEFFDRRVRFNLAAFYNEVSDIQRLTLVTNVTNGVTSTATVVGNAGKARFWGGEAEATVRATRDLTLSATAALVQPKYLTYVDASGDRSDEPFALVAKHTFSLAADYEREFGFGTARLHVDYAWTGETPLFAYRNVVTPGQSQGDVDAFRRTQTRAAFGLVNARATASVLDGKLDLSVFGRNIFNKRNFDTSIALGAPLNVVTLQRSEPVTYGVTGTFRFGQ